MRDPGNEVDTVAWQIRSWRVSYLFFQFYELSIRLYYQIYFGIVAASKVNGVS